MNNTRAAELRQALEMPDAETDILIWAALRTSQAKVYHDHLEQCREIIGGKVASVPDAVLALRDDRALLIAALEEIADCTSRSDWIKVAQMKEIAREAMEKVKR